MRECNKFKSISLSIIPKSYTHAFYRCYIFINSEFLIKGWNRDRIIKHFNKINIDCNVGSCSEIYLENVFFKKKYKPKKRLQNAKTSSERSIAFLVHPTLSKEYINYTCKEISKLMSIITL